MEMPAVEVSPGGGQQVSDYTSTLEFKGTESIRKLQRIGFRILLLGMTEEKFMGKFSFHHAFLFFTLMTFHTIYACYEAMVTVFFCRGLLEKLSHGYIATYLFAFNSQWYFMLMNFRKLHEDELYLENFESTKAFPQYAERELSKNVVTFKIVLAMSIGWWSTNSMTHTIGPCVELLLSLIRHGKITDSVFVLPPVFVTPWWAQIIIYVCNAITMTCILLYCIASYTIMGSKVVKVKTQCDVLNEALRNDVGEESRIKTYIKDHQALIKKGKQLNEQLAVLNGLMFTACYLEFAVQMFALTLIEVSGAYYFAMAFDLLSIFLILAFQCWMGSIITHSLESISIGVYETDWYRRKKCHHDVILMTQMAQKPYIQYIWFGTTKVERATILDLVRSSYAMYTFLMIFQDK